MVDDRGIPRAVNGPANTTTPSAGAVIGKLLTTEIQTPVEVREARIVGSSIPVA
jgi:hypothetical protein